MITEEEFEKLRTVYSSAGYPHDELWFALERTYEETKRLEGRVDELLARGTALENERRSWKARARTYRRLLIAATVDAPAALAQSLEALDDPKRKNRLPIFHHYAGVHATIQLVAERAANLEADVWSKAPRLVREFLDEVCASEGGLEDDSPIGSFVRKWAERFADELIR